MKKAKSSPSQANAQAGPVQSKKQDTATGKDTKGELLKQLRSLSVDTNNKNIQEVLKAIFESGRAQDKYDKIEERKTIGKALKLKLDKIFIFMLNYAYDFEPSRLSWCLVFRSAIQFMLDEYKDFPSSDGKEVLQTALIEIQRKCDAKELLDKKINFCKQNRAFGIDIETNFRKSLAKPSGIPQSHCWWN